MTASPASASAAMPVSVRAPARLESRASSRAGWRQLQARQQQPTPGCPGSRHDERRGGFGLRTRILSDADAVQPEGDGRDLALHPGEQRVRNLLLHRVDGRNHRGDLVGQNRRVGGDGPGVGSRATERVPIAVAGRVQQGFATIAARAAPARRRAPPGRRWTRPTDTSPSRSTPTRSAARPGPGRPGCAAPGAAGPCTGACAPA